MEKYNFIENKWYSFNWDYSGKDCMVIAKIEQFNHEMISISWRKYLWDNTISIRDAYEYVDISNIKELSLCDIQQYLPEDHPEKIKVGSYLIRPDATAPKALKITKITRGEYYTNPPILFEPHPLLRFATEEEINKAENKLENLEKEFVLPEKWCIKVTDENKESLERWRPMGGIYSTSDYMLNDDFKGNSNSKGYVVNTPNKDYIEITFEQFRKYVLKETATKVEETPKQEPMKIAVHVKTSEEFDFVISKIREKSDRYNSWNVYRTESCIVLDDGCYQDIDWFSKNNYRVVSFEDWCKDNGYIFAIQESKKYEWKTIDFAKISIENSFESTNTQENINILPKPKELEIVPISKYFKIRN